MHFDEVCERIASLRSTELADVDVISSAGERWSSALLVALMAERGVDGQLFEGDSVVVTDGIVGNSRPLVAETRARLKATVLPSLERGCIPVVTGFFGASSSGVLTTLGRGGTDLSAAVVGACLHASEILLWKVEHSSLPDGRMQDWKAGWEGVVHDAVPTSCIPEISYNEAATLAHLGKKVLHPDTVMPAVELRIPIGVRNTLAPTHPGTRICADALPLYPGLPFDGSLGSASTSYGRICTVTSCSVADYATRHRHSLDGASSSLLTKVESDAGLVALVGENASRLGPYLIPWALAVLRAAGIHSATPLPHEKGLGAHMVIVCVPEPARKVAVRALHGAFASQLGSPFELGDASEQVAASGEQLRRRLGLGSMAH